MSRILIALVASLTFLLPACEQAGSESATEVEARLQAEAKDEAAANKEVRQAAAEGAAERDRAIARNNLAAQQTAQATPPTVVAARCADCGTVRSIEPVKQKGEASGAGAVAGAIIGGVIGHQFGSGRGKDAATAGGAIAGGVAGHQIEKERNSTSFYRVTVAMDEGGTRTVNIGDPAGLTVGSKVKVIGNDLQPRY